MKITVTGGSGFLGSHAADALTKKGHKVKIFDKKKSKWISFNQKMYIGNILNPNHLKKAIKDSDVVFHFAALADMDEALHKPVKTVINNILGTVNVLELCKKYNIKRIIYASSIYSMSVQGGFYRCSKKASEDYIEEYYKRYGLNFTILRYGSLYGPRANKTNGIHRIVKEALMNKQLEYIGKKSSIRKYIHVSDAAKATANIISPNYKNKYVNIVGEKSYKVTELLNIVSKSLKLTGKINFLNSKKMGHYIKSPKLFRLRTGINYRLKKYTKFKHGINYLIHNMKKDI